MITFGHQRNVTATQAHKLFIAVERQAQLALFDDVQRSHTDEVDRERGRRPVVRESLTAQTDPAEDRGQQVVALPVREETKRDIPDRWTIGKTSRRFSHFSQATGRTARHSGVLVIYLNR